MIRISLTVALIVWWTLSGGTTGFAAAILILGLLGLILPPRRVRIEQSPQDDPQMEKIQPARRGSAVDPTRPTQNDIQAMQANNFTRRKR